MFKNFWPSMRINSVYDINFEKLYNKGYRGLLFDIDNTLVFHDAPADSRIKMLFEKIRKIGFKTYIISNNDEPRVKKFSEKIKSKYLFNAHKPNPRMYLKAIKKMKLEKKEVIFIGDQLFTDIYGANVAGINNILVNPLGPEIIFKVKVKRIFEKPFLYFCKSKERKLY